MNSSDDLLVKEGKSLPLMEAFYSIQGEGFYSGKASYFLRIGGCDVGCESHSGLFLPNMEYQTRFGWTTVPRLRRRVWQGSASFLFGG